MRIIEYGQHVINIVLLVLALFSVNFIIRTSNESEYILGIVILVFFILALFYVLITNAILLIFGKVHNFLFTSSKEVDTLVNIPRNVEERANTLFKLISISMSSIVLLVVMDYFINDDIFDYFGYKDISIEVLNIVLPTKWILILGKPLLAILVSYLLWVKIMQPMYNLVNSYDHSLRNIWITVYPQFVRISSDLYKSESIDIVIQDISPKKGMRMQGEILVRFPRDVVFYEDSIFNDRIEKQEFLKKIELSHENPSVEIKLIPVYLGSIKTTGVVIVRIEFENGIVYNYSIGTKLVPE